MPRAPSLCFLSPLSLSLHSTQCVCPEGGLSPSVTVSSDDDFRGLLIALKGKGKGDVPLTQAF